MCKVLWHPVLLLQITTKHHLSPSHTAAISLKHWFNFFQSFYFLSFISELHMTYDRKTVINFRKENVELGLSALDLEVMSANSISWPAVPMSVQAGWLPKEESQCQSPRQEPRLSLYPAYLWHSQENKMDEARPMITQYWEIRDGCGHIFTETWLQPNILVSAIALHEQTVLSTKCKRRRCIFFF